MPTYKLTYFPLRARAEMSRYIFAVAGKEYEDIRIPFDEWPQKKQNMRFGQLPVLEVDGKQLAQSYAIARYLANEFNLGGSDKWEAAMADMYAGAVEDLFAPTARTYFEKDEKLKATLLENYKTEKVPGVLGNFEKALSQSESGFLVGNSLTYADLALLSLIEFMEGMWKDEVKPLIAKYENIQKHRAKIQAIPAIATWISKRPANDF